MKRVGRNSAARRGTAGRRVGARLLWMVAFVLVLACASLWAAGKQEAGAAAASVQTKPVKILMIQMDTGGWEADDNQKVKDLIEKDSGIKFEMIHAKDDEELAKKANLVLASQEDVDAFEVSTQRASMWDMVDRGALMALNKPLEQYGSILKKHFSEDVCWAAVKDKDGKIWAIPRRQGNMGNMVFIRKDWREKLGFKTPPSTLADLEAYLKAVKTGDPDGNGKVDSFPMVARNYNEDFERVLPYIITGVPCGYDANYIDEQGRVVPHVMHPKYKDYLAKMAQWHKEGILHPEQYTLKRNQVEDLVIANRVGASIGWYSNIVRPWETLMKKVPEAYYEYPQIKLENGKPYQVPRQPPGTAFMGIVSYSKNVEWAIKLFQWSVTSPTNYLITREGLPGPHWEWADQAKAEIKQYKDPQKRIYRKAYALTEDSHSFPTRVVNIDPGFVRNKYDEIQMLMQNIGYVWSPDWFVAYKWKGTPVENSMADAQTLIEEAVVNIIIGKRPVSDWDAVIAQYRKMHGDKYIELATRMYNEYQKK